MTLRLADPPTTSYSAPSDPTLVVRHVQQRDRRDARPGPASDGHRDGESFLTWLMSSQKPDEISLDGDTTVPLARLLGRLSTSQRPLPSAACAQLGLPEATRLGDAAVALLLAVRDPSGPRCRSYRSAAFYLRGLHHLSYNVDDLDLSASG